MSVLISLIFSVLSTIDHYEKFANDILYWLVKSFIFSLHSKSIHTFTFLLKEMFLVAFLGIEFLVRIWSAGCRSYFEPLSKFSIREIILRSTYMGLMGRLRFIRKPICLIGKIMITIDNHVLSFNGNFLQTL